MARREKNKQDHACVVEHFAEATFGKVPDTPAVFDVIDEMYGRLTRRRAFVSDNPEKGLSILFRPYQHLVVMACFSATFC